MVDLGPVLSLLGIAALVAAVFLSIFWLRRAAGARTPWRLALTVFTLFLTFDLVLFGAFTRLTDSGLGCPDWPGCYGTASPLAAHADIAQAEAAMPGGPVTHGKAWIEMLHRYLASGVGALIAILAVAACTGGCGISVHLLATARSRCTHAMALGFNRIHAVSHL